MKYYQAVPATMIVISVISCGCYVVAGDWRRAVYWFAAALITTVITF
jgi:5-enolpyruvylshikimate-3-phosphate synthase